MNNYAKVANEARKRVLKMIFDGQVSHIGSNFSVIDILSVLFDKAKISGELNKSKDIIIASKGWCAASIYYFLAQKGLIPESDLDKFCDGKSPYIGLVEPTVPGIFASGGSMGYGLSFGAAFAWDKKDKGEDGKVYVVMSDGEQAIGMNYEAARNAAHDKLDNLVAIIDYNGWCAMGKTNEVLNIEPLRQYWESLGWLTSEIKGHDHAVIADAITDARDNYMMYPIGFVRNGIKKQKDMAKPTVIIAKTIKGRGVSWMENSNLWHYSHLSKEDYENAMSELNK